MDALLARFAVFGIAVCSEQDCFAIAVFKKFARLTKVVELITSNATPFHFVGRKATAVLKMYMENALRSPFH